MSYAIDLPIAANTWIWHCPLVEGDIHDRLRTLSAWGFDAVETPLESVGDWDAERARATLDEIGMDSLVGCVMAPGRELGAADRETTERTKAYVRGCIDHAVRQGSPLVIGPLITSVGRTWRMDADERRRVLSQVRDNLAELADYAGAQGIVLGIEPLNRYETSLCNTSEQLMELLDGLPAESIGANLDTYHMNIEETSWAAAFDAVGDRLVHLQVCGNDRGAPGADHTDWGTIRNALVRNGYRGALGIESFTAFNETIATAASVWRPLAATQDDLARDGLAFLQDWRSGF